MKPRAKQERLPGTEEKLIPEIVTLADEYVEVRDERMELTKREVDTRDRLLDAMKKHSLTEYSFDGKEIQVLAGKEKIKVKTFGDEEDEDQE